MNTETTLLSIIPVLPSLDILRDVTWYKEKTGFKCQFFDEMYAALYRDNLSIHLQWHAGTEDDPLLGGSVIRVFVKNIVPLFEEFVERETIGKDKLVANTPWNTSEFGFYDLNKNAIFFVEDLAWIIQEIIIDTCKELEITAPALSGRRVDIAFKNCF